MIQQDHVKVGHMQLWMEQGKLTLYTHAVGGASGAVCSLNAEEAKGLLELLERHKTEIDEAAGGKPQDYMDYTGGWS